MEITSGTPGNNTGIVRWGWGCQRAQICSLTMLHVSHHYLVSLSFYTIPIRRIFNLLSTTVLSDTAIGEHAPGVCRIAVLGDSPLVREMLTRRTRRACFPVVSR